MGNRVSDGQDSSLDAHRRCRKADNELVCLAQRLPEVGVGCLGCFHGLANCAENYSTEFGEEIRPIRSIQKRRSEFISYIGRRCIQKHLGNCAGGTTLPIRWPVFLRVLFQRSELTI